MYNLEGCKAVAAAVVKRAVIDYTNALRTLRNHPKDCNAIRIRCDCERFFREEISLYTDLDGKYIMDKVYDKVKQEVAGHGQGNT